MRIIKFMLLALFLFVSGCGYTTSSLLPPELDSIYVEPFANKIDPAAQISNKNSSYIYMPNTEYDITRTTIDEFIFDRHLAIKSEKKASMTLEGELTAIKLFPLSYDGADNVTEFRMCIYVNLKLYDNLNGKILWQENSFMGETSYDVSGPNAKTQEDARKYAVRDLAQRIVERTVEAW